MSPVLIRTLLLLIAECGYYSGLAGAETSDTKDARMLMERVVDAEAGNRRRMVNYLFQETVIRKSFDRNRQLISQQSSVFEVIFIEGKPAFRRISINGRELTAEEEKSEAARLRQLAEDRHANPGIASPAEDRRRSHPLPAFVKLHEFVLAGSEVIDGRECWVVTSKPKRRGHADTPDQERVRAATGKFWIDKDTLHRVRMDVTALHPEGPAQVREYTRYQWGQRDGEVWLITSIETVLPLRGGRTAYYEGEQTYSNYRRFTSESSVSVTEELASPQK